MNKDFNSVFFLPRVGKNYSKGGIFGKRIMVLGESHYCAEHCADCGAPCHNTECGNFTSNVMERYFDADCEYEPWMNTFRKFERSLVNKVTDRTLSREIWDSLLFYNYLQVAMTQSRVAGNKEDYFNAETAFYEILEVYRPEFVIVWGYRLWNNLPNGESWGWNEDVNIDGTLYENGYYQLKDGSKVNIIAIQHPSSGYSWDYWHRVIDLFLNR